MLDCDRCRRFHIARSSKHVILPRFLSRYGLRATRVGEASNPGPPKFFRRLRRGASTISEVASTVPASAQDVQAARSSPEVGGSPTVVDMSLDDSDREGQAHMSGNRFAVLGEDVDRLDPVARPRRRLVLVSQNPEFVGSDHEWDPNTESIGGASEVDDGEEVPEQSLFETPIVVEPRVHARGRRSRHCIL